MKDIQLLSTFAWPGALIRRISVFGLLFLAGAVCAQGADDEAKREAVRDFKTYFRKFKESAKRVEAVQTLKGMESVGAALELLKILDDPDQQVRNAAMAVLTSYRATATFQSLLEELPDVKKPERKALLIEVLGRAKLAAALPVFAPIAENKRENDGVRWAIARAIPRIGKPEGIPLLKPLIDADGPLVRKAAIEAAGQLRAKELGSLIVPKLEDKEWQVQAAAVAAAGQIRIPEAIDGLIALMRKNGRLKTECADSLFLITMLDFGVEPDEWQRQWDTLKSLGDSWRIPTDEEVKKAAESRKRNDAFYGKKEETNSFGGITTTSTRVLFIIDVSGSMDDRVVDVARFRDGGYRDMKKLTIVKTELLRTIEGLSANTIFNIVAFASDLKTWKRRLTPANIVNRESAKSWVKRLEPIGGADAADLAAAGLGGSANLQAGKTNTLKALMYAFGIDPKKPVKAPITKGGKVSMKNKLDTVFFLSDGRPSTGVLVDTEEITAEVARVNEMWGITIHTIAIGDFQKNFLKQLALQNKGVFVDLGK